MNKILIIAEHNGTELNISTNKCVSCADKLPDHQIDVALFANNGDHIATQASKISNVNKVILIDSDINENALASKGTKRLYVQVIGPDNNVVADKGAVEFGEASLIYSAKTEIEYSNEAIEVHTSIRDDNAFKKGRYYISVFENDRKLGSTQILLN